MLVIEHLHKSFPTAQGPLQVLRGVDLTLARGSSLALMGESGSGKAPCCTWSPALTVPTAGAS